MLKYVGVETASLLNGSWETWVDSDRPVETSMTKVATTYFRPHFQTDRLEQIDSLKNSLTSDRVRVVDTRSDSEFAGGRIPGSAHLEWTEGVVDRSRTGPRRDLDHRRAALLQVENDADVNRVRVASEKQGITVHQLIKDPGLV